MEVIVEEFAIYGFVAILILTIVLIYIRKQRRESKEVEQKIKQAKEDGFHEPVSLYPVVDPNRCIKSGSCITACPEKDILGIRNNKATIINASRCIGHGACFRACPVEAISLWIGTEKRGVDLPHVSPTFETNVKGIFIAGEIGGMGLIKNAVAQGREAVENIVKVINKNLVAEYDLIVVGAGPAGIAATLEAKKSGLNVLTLEQDTLGGTISTFPRSKIVMTQPVELPLYGKMKLRETNKSQLLEIWEKVISTYNIKIKENSKVQTIIPDNGIFKIETSNGDKYTSRNIILAIGRRGSPRKLNVPGEESEKVAYRLLEPEEIRNKNILVVGGGDSAVESALMLSGQNNVTLSYRGEKFNRLKPKNSDKIKEAILNGIVDVKFNTTILAIEKETIIYKENNTEQNMTLRNDMVYIFAGGELPTEFLKNTGIDTSTKYGEAVLKH